MPSLVLGSALAQFTITLSVAATEPVSVTWFTKDGTALAGRDYETNSGAVVFAPGELSKVVEVFVHGRAIDTEDRVFYVRMLPPVNAILADEVGACVIHVDTEGTEPVLTVVIPKGEKGERGYSAYEIAVQNGFVGTEAEWLASLEPDPEELAALVAPLIDGSVITVTARGTQGLAKPDTDTLAGFAGRMPFTAQGKKAVAPAMLAGTNIIPMSAFVGEAVDPNNFTGFAVVALRGTSLLSLPWQYLPASSEIRVTGASAGDIPIAVELAIGGKNTERAMVTVAGVLGSLASFLEFLQAGSGAVPRSGNSKLLELHKSPSDFGAVGDGVANDFSGYSQADAASEYVYLPHGKTYALPVGTVPLKPVAGPGKVKIGAVTFTGPELYYDLFRTSLYCLPPSYADEVAFPGGTQGNLTIMLAPGGKRVGNLNRCTFIGTQGPKKGIDIDRCEAYGNGALMNMRFGERTVAVGSIACQWLGTNDPQGDGHEWWVNAGGFIPGQPGWDYQGMETRNPGIGAQIAAFSGFATQPTDCGRSVALGRNALNGTVLALNVTAVGYRAAAGSYAISNLLAMGTDAFRDGVFQKDGVALGVFAGSAWQVGERNTVVGYNAGGKAVRGARNTLLGSYAGYDYTDLNDCTLIGHGAGNVIGGTALSNVLCVGLSGTLPLLSGRLNDFALGVNILPSKIKGTLHVRTNDFGAEAAAHTLADDLVVENSVGVGISLRSPADASGNLFFARPGSNQAGGVSYTHSSDTLALIASSATRYEMDSTALYPSQDNVRSFGTASRRASVVYAGSGSINTSDGTLKKVRGALNEAEVRAWSRVQPLVFQFLDMVKAKGEAVARWHAGYIAQAVRDAFLAEGLDPARYALWCEDEITVPVLKTRPATRHKLIEVQEAIEEIEVVGGLAVLRKTSRPVLQPQFEVLPVMDEEGKPVMQADKTPRTHSVPVMEEYEEEYMAYEPGGTRLGLRYDQCQIFENAYLRSLIAELRRDVDDLKNSTDITA